MLAWVHKAIQGTRQDRTETVGNNPVVCVGHGDRTGLECFLASALLRDEEDVCPVESTVGTLARFQVSDDLQKNRASDVNQGFVHGERDTVPSSRRVSGVEYRGPYRLECDAVDRLGNLFGVVGQVAIDTGPRNILSCPDGLPVFLELSCDIRCSVHYSVLSNKAGDVLTTGGKRVLGIFKKVEG